MQGGQGKLQGGIIHRTSSLKTASEIAEKEGYNDLTSGRRDFQGKFHT